MPATPALRLASGAAGLALMSAAFWLGKSLTTQTVTPHVTTGTVKLVSISADAFILRPTPGGQLTGYPLPRSIPWRNAYGVWQDDGRPACMAPLTHGQRITIGVINAAPVAGAPGAPVIVWLECPAKPIPKYPIVSPSIPAPAPGSPPALRAHASPARSPSRQPAPSPPNSPGSPGSRASAATSVVAPNENTFW